MLADVFIQHKIKKMCFSLNFFQLIRSSGQSRKFQFLPLEKLELQMLSEER